MENNSLFQYDNNHDNNHDSNHENNHKSYIKPINRLVLGVALFIACVDVVAFFLPVGLTNNMLFGILLSELIFLLPTLIFFILSKPKLSDFFQFRRIKISTVFLTLLGFVLLAPIIVFLNMLSQLLVPNAAVSMFGAMSGYSYAVIFFAFAILAPLVEEFLFRGVILGGYKRTANRFAAILMSALLFGLVHGNLNQMPYAFVLGIYLALLAEATGTILAPLIAHFVFNAWNLLIMITGGEAAFEATAGNQPTTMELFQTYADQFGLNTLSLRAIIAVSFAIYFAVAFAFCILVYLVLKRIAKNEGNTESFQMILSQRKKTKERIMTAPLIAAIVLFILYIVLTTIASLLPLLPMQQ